MIKIENYCKPNTIKLLGIKGAFDEEIEGELKPCPLCGRIPKPMVRVDSLDGYFSAVSCFGGVGCSHAYVSAIGHGNYMDVLNAAINEWNSGIIKVDEKDDYHKHHLYSMKEDALIEDCCRTCLYCRYIKTPEVTGNPVDYICQNKGSVVSDIDIKNCDEMYSPKTPKVKVEVK